MHRGEGGRPLFKHRHIWGGQSKFNSGAHIEWEMKHSKQGRLEGAVNIPGGGSVGEVSNTVLRIIVLELQVYF